MIATWMAYSVALGVLIGLAALSLERVAALWGRPRRLVWAAAVATSLLVPPAALVLPRPPTPPPASPGAAPPAAHDIGALPPAPAPRGRQAPAVRRLTASVAVLDTPLLVLWAGASLFLALGLARAAVALRRRARGWTAAVVDGVPVLVARDAGPAVVRLSGLRVVLPQWALAAEVASRSLMLRHEREHCGARDPDLLLGATLALVLAPWNLALWWQMRRLQLAVETDCDRRVMRAGADAHTYGSLLLTVGARHAWQPLLAASSFAETPSLLTRRIEAMTSPRPRHPATRAALAAAVASLAIVAAGMTPQPAPLSTTGRVGAQTLATGFRTCTDTVGVQLSVSREAGAATVADEDLAAATRMVVGSLGYASQFGPAAAREPIRLEVSLTLRASHAEARTTLTRAGTAAGGHGTNQATLPTNAGAATIGSVLGAAIQSSLRGLPLGNCVDWSTFASEQRTAAVMEAVRRHAAGISRLPRPQDAGLWLVQDSSGHYISSGVLDSFPTSISSTNYRTVVPGASAAGQEATAFGFARTPVVDGAGPFRLVYVTVARRP